MPTARDFLAAAVVDGKIYVLGGMTGVPTNVVERYDPVTDTWATMAPMPTGRYDLTAQSVNGKIYAIGGTSNAFVVTNIVEQCDPVTNTWTTKTPMPTARGRLAAAVVDNKIYALGGRESMDPAAVSAKVEEYDPSKDL